MTSSLIALLVIATMLLYAADVDVWVVERWRERRCNRRLRKIARGDSAP